MSFKVLGDCASVDVGYKGSCARPNNDASVNCTFPSVSPQYGVFLLLSLFLRVGED